MALTPAQKQKAYRERQKLKPDAPKTAYFKIQGSLVDDLDYLAELLDMNRTNVMQDLLTASLRMVLPTIKEDAEQLRERINEYPDASPETFKKVMMAFWGDSLAAMKS